MVLTSLLIRVALGNHAVGCVKTGNGTHILNRVDMLSGLEAPIVYPEACIRGSSRRGSEPPPTA